MNDWMQVLWLVLVLILVGPAALQIIRGNPQFALRSVAGWLGVIVALGFLYTNTGIAEWWDAKHGGGLRNDAPVEIRQPESLDDSSNLLGQ